MAHNDYAGNGYHYDSYPINANPFKTFFAIMLGMAPGNSGMYASDQYISTGQNAELLKDQVVKNGLGGQHGIFPFMLNVSIADITDVQATPTCVARSTSTQTTTTMGRTPGMTGVRTPAGMPRWCVSPIPVLARRVRIVRA